MGDPFNAADRRAARLVMSWASAALAGVALAIVSVLVLGILAGELEVVVGLVAALVWW